MNTQFRLSVLAAACLSVTYSSIALAETSSKDETETLATIVVTASREGESISNTPAAISKIVSLRNSARQGNLGPTPSQPSSRQLTP